MSGSDRGSETGLITAATIASITVTIGLLFYVYSIGSVSGYQAAEQKGYSQNDSQATNQAISQCRLKPEPTLEKCIAEQIKAGRDDHRSEEDLNAQRNMANWAWYLLILTFAQIPLGIIGLVALVVTIRQGRDANKIARDSSERQLRAYVAVEKVEIFAHQTKPNHIYIAAHFKNVGETPAKDVSANLFGRVYPGIHFECDMTPGETTGGRSVLVMSKDSKPSVIVHAVELFHGNTGAFIMNGAFSVFAFGSITYVDIFGKKRETTFCSVNNPETRQSPINVTAARSGNSIT